MGSGFSKMKKQARMMQEQYAKMQEEMKLKEVVGSSGNGLVSVVLSGDGKMKKLTIKPECIDPQDVEGLEDLIKAAHEEAHKQLKEQSEEEMPLPAGLSMPFSF
jgi:DNA-binding YbaB/EbfC family protein